MCPSVFRDGKIPSSWTGSWRRCGCRELSITTHPIYSAGRNKKCTPAGGACVVICLMGLIDKGRRGGALNDFQVKKGTAVRRGRRQKAE